MLIYFKNLLLQNHLHSPHSLCMHQDTCSPSIACSMACLWARQQMNFIYVTVNDNAHNPYSNNLLDNFYWAGLASGQIPFNYFSPKRESLPDVPQYPFPLFLLQYQNLYEAGTRLCKAPRPPLQVQAVLNLCVGHWSVRVGIEPQKKSQGFCPILSTAGI